MMDLAVCADGHPIREIGAPVGDEARQRPLVLILKDLLDYLATIIDGLPETLDEASGVWEDEASLYLETELRCPLPTPIDVCIQGGRAFIRLEK